MNKIIRNLKIQVIRKCVGIVLILFTTLTVAQSDNELWLSAGSKINLFSGLQFSAEEGVRFKNSIVDQTYTDLSLEYELIKDVDISMTYRNGQRGGFWDVEHFDNRVVLDLTPKYKLDKFDFRLRIRAQRSYRDIYTSKYGYLPEDKFRFRISTRYDWINKMEWELGFEDYLSVQPEATYFDTYRLYVGLKKGFKDYHSVELNYIYQSEMQVRSPNSSHILSFNYRFDFADYLKKQKEIRERLNEKINWYLIPD